MAKSGIITAIIVLILMVGGVLAWRFFIPSEEGIACVQDAKLCSDGSYVSRIPPDCEFALCPAEEEGILVSLPKADEEIKSPLDIKGEARGGWFFEAEFTAEIYDDSGNFLGRTILRAQDDWMTEDFVPFEGELFFSPQKTDSGVLRFLSANPSGLPEHQKTFEVKVRFEEAPYRKILLYYYNPEKDKDETSNVKCSADGLAAVEREIPVSETPIQDTINLLLKGRENLTQEEINQGITTEYPLEGFSLIGANLKSDGTLILEFEDVQNRTVGGSCRVGILWFQISATAKQFSRVEKVRFLPEEFFQP